MIVGGIEMNAYSLYKKMEEQFISNEVNDKWFKYMGEIDDFVCDNFKRRSMGLVCDNTSDVEYVYSAVFPSKDVMEHILKTKVEHAMLFVHHPSIWGITNLTSTFYQMSRRLLQEFRDRKISIYCLHTPLDAFGEFSTGVALAEALQLDVVSAFGLHCGVKCGVCTRTTFATVQDLQREFSRTIGHDAKLYLYGESEIRNGKVAVLPGGGNDINFIREVVEMGINTVITGVSTINVYTKKTHLFERNNLVNVIGGTHYSTEKFACQKMCKFFCSVGLSSEFIAEKPLMHDL